ncbi:MAG: hypothetical protein FWB76_02220 [Oscillospiraceae bacterium]|nr:hypothetical protein [Oscillospiraceae bacterium]
MKRLRVFTWLQLLAASLLAVMPLELVQQLDVAGVPTGLVVHTQGITFWLSMVLVCVIVGAAIVVICKLKHVRLTWPMFVLLVVFVARHIVGSLILQQPSADMRAMTINMMVTTVLMLVCVAVTAVLAARTLGGKNKDGG